jgi:hypothetical protein
MLQHPGLRHGDGSDVAVVSGARLLAGVSLPGGFVGVERGRRVIRPELGGDGLGCKG